MKEIFENQVGFNTAKINVNTSVGNIDLFYHLSDNPVQHIWQDIHLNSTKIISGQNSGKTFKTLLDNLNRLCIIENVNPLSSGLSQNDLNDLHNLYVQSNHNQNWQKINELIHLLENKLDDPLSEYDNSINFYSDNKKSVALEEEHKMFLTSDAIWGRLVLGYATLGKDWVVIPGDNDDRTDLELQKYITSEAYLSFSCEEPYPCFRELKTYNWAKSKNFYVPIDNLNKLNLGRYFLGQIIITDNLLDFHPCVNDWYVNNHSCKLNFNTYVLGENFTVNSVNFLDTDLAFKQFLKHTQFPCKK